MHSNNVCEHILIIMNIIIINIKAIVLYTMISIRNWMVDTETDTRTADSAVSEMENRHHL